MSLYALHLANGRTRNTGVFRLMGRLLSGSGVIEPTGFTVSAQGTPDMTVKVSGSTTSDNLVIITATGDTYHGWNTANANVTISSNSTGVTVKDHIVAYIDTALTTTTPDNPGGLVLIAVRGTGTAAPTDTQINTATGSKPWLRLAEVSVANGAGSINSGNIVDLRTFATVDSAKLPSPTLGYAQINSNFTSAGTAEQAVTGLSTTVTVPAGGKRIKVTAYTGQLIASIDNSRIDLSIYEDSTRIGTSYGTVRSGVSGGSGPVSTVVVKVPTAGSHTYSVRVTVSVGSGTATVFSDSVTAAFLLVELI